MRKPIIYIGGPGYDPAFYQVFEPMLSSVSEHFESIISRLPLVTAAGTQFTVDLQVRADNPEEIYAYAQAIAPQREYRIALSAGLAYHIWLASRFVLADFPFFRWLDKVRLSGAFRGMGKKEALSHFSFFICSYSVLLHELAHIVLGHCDYMHSTSRLPVSEFDATSRVLTEHELSVSRALEADADRQAGEWLMVFFESSLGDNGRGQGVEFPSRVAVYEFYTYAVTSLFVVLQQLTEGKAQKHPTPNQRQYAALIGVDLYFSKFGVQHRKLLFAKVQEYMWRASALLGLRGNEDRFKLAETAVSMVFVDSVLNGIEIRRYSFRGQ